MKLPVNKIKYFVERGLIIILLLCLLAQVTYIIRGRNLRADAQIQYNDGRGGESAPPPPGQIPQPPPPGQEGMPPGGQMMQPQPGRIPGQPPEMPPQPRSRPGGRVVTYPSIPKGRELTELDKQKIETRYNLHRWVLSDLLWSLVAIEESKEYRLSDAQVKKIYPSVKKLVRSVEVVEKSNRLMEGLLTKEQKDYIEKKLYDGDYMAGFLARYSPGEQEPIHSTSNTILDKVKAILTKKIKESE